MLSIVQDILAGEPIRDRILSESSKVNESVDIDGSDLDVLRDIAQNNALDVKDIIGLLMDGYLDELVTSNNWETAYDLKGGSPWKLMSFDRRDV